MSEEKQEETRILPSRILIELDELSAKQRKAVLGLVKDMGFVPEEINEVVVVMPGSEYDVEAAGITAGEGAEKAKEL